MCLQGHNSDSELPTSSKLRDSYIPPIRRNCCIDPPLCVFLSSCTSHKMFSLSSHLLQSSVSYLSQHRFTFHCQNNLDYLYPHSVSASLRAEKHHIKSVNQRQTYKMQNNTKMATLLCSLSCHGCYRYKFTQDGGIRFTQSS